MDIVTRLLLKTNDFDANLNKAKGSVNNFQGGISNMAKTAGAGVMKFAGTLGVAVGAYEAFNKTVNSTQTTGDAWVKMQDQMKASVDSFFASIAMGNFDGFLSNLQNVIDKAGDLSVALDNLGTKTLFNNSETNDLNTKYQTEINKAKARNISDKERNEHLQKAKGYLVEMAKLQSSLAKSNTDTSYVTLQADIAKQGFDRNVARDTWEYLLKDSNRADIDRRAATYNETVSGYKDKLSHSRDPKTGEWITKRESDELEKKLHEYESSKKGNFDRLASVFVELADDENSAIASAIKMRATANALSVSISQKELEIANADAKINGSYNSNNGSGTGKPTPPPSGSLGDINAKITAENKKLTEATTEQARKTVLATINELEQKKIILEMVVKKEAFEVKHGKMKEQDLSSPTPSNTPIVGDYQTQQALIAWYNQSIAAKKAELSNVTDVDAQLSIQMQINKLERLLKEYQELINKAESVSGGSIYSAFRNNSSKGKNGEELDLRKQLPDKKLPKFKSPIKKDDVDLNQQYADSLLGIGIAFGSMGQMANQFGEDGLSFALNSIGSIAQMIVQLESLATAQGVASAMSLPFPANLGAIATVIGTITSIFSSLPSFETGGVIPGTSFSGDKVLARVNSGEMILNDGQQANLFRLLNGGIPSADRVSASPQLANLSRLIAPSEGSQKIELAGSVKVKGQDLELSFKNRNRITGKIK